MNRQIVLKSRPIGAPQPSDFDLQERPLPDLKDGELLVENHWLSLDPYMRGRMSDAPSYAAPLQIGEVMEGETVGKVLASQTPRFAPGDWVVGRGRWQTHAVLSAEQGRKLRPDFPKPSLALGLLGMPGVTAYTGLKHIGQPQPGETVVVAAASGAVGAVVGQLAKQSGCRVIGLAGTEDKCRYVTESLGFDACLNHRASDLVPQLKDACPQGIDVYFENVGGRVFDAVFPLLNDFARIPVCGLISFYNATALPTGPDRTPLLMRAILTKRLTFRGFIVTDFLADWPEALQALEQAFTAGTLQYREQVLSGLEAAPQGLIDLLEGKNFGKVVVQLKPEDA